MTLKVLVLLLAYSIWGAGQALTLHMPSELPNLTRFVMVQAPQPPAAQPQEHPWERRLRRVEMDLIRQAAYGEQATKEAKEIIKDRTQRLEELEQWMKQQEKEAQIAKQKAAEALRKAETTSDDVAANSDKLHEVSKKVDSVASPWSWESLIKALGGSAVVTGVLIPLILRKFSNLRSELEANEALPGPNNPPPATIEVVKPESNFSLRNI